MPTQMTLSESDSFEARSLYAKIKRSNGIVLNGIEIVSASIALNSRAQVI